MDDNDSDEKNEISDEDFESDLISLKRGFGVTPNFQKKNHPSVYYSIEKNL
jgi:hypothetical protein